MHKTNLAKFVEEIKEISEEKKDDEYITINLRPGEKVSSMMKIIAAITSKSPSMIVNTNLSHEIAEHASVFHDDKSKLLDAVIETIKQHNGVPSNSAISLLIERGIIKINQSSVHEDFEKPKNE